MPSLLERLNNALAPDFEVERELARGGMGAVFLAHDTNLRRRVAIKVLLPELATAAATSRFLREARVLASLSHSHIVPVHSVGERDGLSYYVMDYMEGETLKDRLRRGAMSREETVKIGRDILDALESVHRAGVTHRDIKPANMFLAGRRALLGDFGIAKPAPDSTETITGAGVAIGTPGYMAPEQAVGHATPRSDIYGLGMVLYELLTARRWESGMDPRDANWKGVPRAIERVLVRALAVLPGDRWPDAQTFRHHLWATRVRRYQWRTAALSAAGIVVGGITVWLAMGIGEPGSPVGKLSVQVQRFEYRGDSADRWVADSISTRLERVLNTISEFRVSVPDEEPAVVLSGLVKHDGAVIDAEVWSESSSSSGSPVRVPFVNSEWETVADSVAASTMLQLWSKNSPFASWLAIDAVPSDPQAFNAWLAAGRLAEEGRFDDAIKAYEDVVKIDSTCVYCSWQITELQRWLGGPPDSIHRRLVIDGRDRFPPHYQSLIWARLELRDRLDALRVATKRWSDFYYAWYLLGEEQFNRGPLYGLRRAEAGESFLQAALLNPGFAPIRWDLAWLGIAEGDSAEARDALARIPEPKDPFSKQIFNLLEVAFGYRFGDADAADEQVRDVLADSAIWHDPRTLEGPRWLPAFDSPDGAVRLGELVSDLGRADLRRSGLIAQMFGYFAQGQIDTSRDRAHTLLEEQGTDAFELFIWKLEAVNRMFDSTGSLLDVARITRQLERYAKPDVGQPAERIGARWILQLLELHHGASHSGHLDSATGVPALDTIVAASRMARAEKFRAAIELGNTVRQWEIAEVVPDPFFRTVLHFLMADWYEAEGNRQKAVEELRWHEAVDQWDRPTMDPVVQEVDWAFGTLARWKRAQLLHRQGDTRGEVCSSFEAVARLWARGDPQYESRADTARQKLIEIGCSTPE